MDTTPKFYYLREDGPITGDIEPLNLDGRDIKIVYDEVIARYYKLESNKFNEYSANGRPLVTVEKSTQYAKQVHLTKKLNTVGSPL